MKSICSLLCLIIASGLGAAELGSWYAGNGTHAYPDATCPTDWDAASGKNIVWKTHLPNWSNGSPLLVDGKLFVMSEPLDYAPILTCIDAKTGAKLWEHVLDPIEEFPKGEQAELRKLAQEGWEWNRQMHRLANQVYNYAGEQFGDLVIVCPCLHCSV